MKTLAVLSEINKPLRLEDLYIPQLKAGQALVNIAYSGICHSQLNEMRGLKGEDKFLPHTLGRKGSGIVEAVGAGVKKVKAGYRVVLTWIKGTGADIAPSSYKDGLTVNSGAISTFMTKTVISENRLVKIPDEMPLREAALLGCVEVGQTQPDRDIPMYAEWVLSGKLDLKRLICREYKLKDINSAVGYMEQNAVGRVLIDMDEK